jgi:hypothetical protein
MDALRAQCVQAAGGQEKFLAVRQAVWKSLWGSSGGGGSGSGSDQDSSGEAATADLSQLSALFSIEEELLNDICALVHMEVDAQF